METPSNRHLVIVFGALLGLLGAALLAAYLPLGRWGPLTAMTIAGAKAALVMIYFMHLRERDGLIRVFALGGFFWLAVLFVLAMSDYLTRGQPL